MRRIFFVAFVVALVAAPAFARRPPPRPSPTPSPTPAPTPAPTPLSAEARVERLRERVAEIAHAAPGRLGVAIVDETFGAHVSVRGDEAFPLADVTELAIALTAFRRADQHRLALDDRLIVTGADLRGGTSPIAAVHPRGNASLAYWELVRAMLVANDTTATDVLLRTVGGTNAVQGVLDRLGLRGFRIHTSEAERASDERVGRSFARGGDNGGTPDAVAALLEGVASQRFLLEDATYEMMGMLETAATGPGRLRAGLPPSATFAHVAGTSATFGGAIDATNDAGVLTLPDGRRIAIVALLADSSADAATRDATLARVARAAYDAFGP